MEEYTRIELEKLIQNQIAKVKQLEFDLRNKQIYREKIEAEIVTLKDEIEKIEGFVKMLEGIIIDEEDRVIMFGLKMTRRLKRGRKTNDESV